MESLFGQLGSLVEGVLSSVPVRLLLLGLATYATIVWLATAHWVYRDMRRRRPDPTTPYMAALGIVLASPVLLPVAVLTYLVLRPGQTIAVARAHELTERLEAMTGETAFGCPGCGVAVDESWLACPACRTRLARLCRSCGRTMGLDWTLCGFCGAEFGRPVIPHRLPAPARRVVADSSPRRASRRSALAPRG